MMTVQALAFDAYGTLFDVYSIAGLAEKYFPAKGRLLAEMWRDKQIEYTRLRTLSNMYKPFWEVTQDALVYVCRKLELNLSVPALNALMGQYAKLSAFPENVEVLKRLRDLSMKTAILSNGNLSMLESAVNAAAMQGLFHHILSADQVRKFKTAPEVYQLAPDIFGLPAKDILFVSSNAWDACCAKWFGFTTFWVNRTNTVNEELGVMCDGEGRNLQDLLTFVQSLVNGTHSVLK
jgi:2-haloacid dehalogenase